MGQDPNELLTVEEAAAMAFIKPSTWRKYGSLGLTPPPDDPGSGPANRRTPRWKRSTVQHFVDNRLGRGRRSDLEGRK